MTVTIQIDGEPRTFELPEAVVRALRSIADRHGITFEQAIAQALVNQKLLEDEVDSGGELLVKKATSSSSSNTHLRPVADGRGRGWPAA